MSKELLDQELLMSQERPTQLHGQGDVADPSVVVPTEIIARGRRAKLAYENALRFGKVKVYRARIMLIGQDRAGKTSLKKSLLGLPFDPEEQSTVAIEVDTSSFKVDVDQGTNWRRTDNKAGLSQFAKELAKMVAGELEKDETKVDSEPQNKPKEKRSHTAQNPVTEDLPRHKAANFSSPKDMKKPEEKSAHAGHHSDRKHQTAPKTPHSKSTSASHHMGKSDLVGRQKSQLEIDPSLPPEEFTKYLIQYLQGLNLQSDSSPTEPVVDIDLWDLAGQHLYYASHPVFLSPRSLYLLVCNLSKRLDDIAEPYVRQGIHDVRLQNPNGETNLENLLSWLVSVNAISPTKQEKAEKEVPYVRPPVLIVGTHADKPFQDIEEMKKQIQEELSGKDYGRHVITPYFSIDNTRSSSDAGVSELQKEILEVLKQEPYMGEEVPVRWFNFEKVVQALVAKNTFYLNIKDLQTIVQEVCFVKGKTEFGVMLDFYHDLGMIVKHGSTVVLQAQWLIDLFKQLITIPRYEDVGNKSKHKKNWEYLQQQGVLCTELVRHVFSKFIEGNSVTEKDILDMMERFDLIAKFAMSTRQGAKYFVPAQLSSSPKVLCEMNPSPRDPCPLYLDFFNGFVPHGIFYQLVSRCIGWCSENGYKRPPALYDHAAKFFIGKQLINTLILLCKKKYIKIVLQYKKPVTEAYLAEAEKVACDVRSFLEGTLKDLSEQLPWRGNLEYELRVACPFCPTEGNACRDHSQISCPHEDCLCLVTMAPAEQLSCIKSFSDKIPTISGLEKWFSRDDRKDKAENWYHGDEDSAVSAKHILQDLRQMQDNAGLVTRETNQVLQDLRKIASDKGLRVSDNQGSGNCMFYALSEQLESVLGIRIQHEEVRNTLVQYLKINPQLPDGTDLFWFVDGYQSWDDYLTKMEQDGTWGDHVILRAAANCYETCIQVVSSLPHVNDVIIRPDRGVVNRKPLVLGHVHEIHYVSLQPTGLSERRRLRSESSVGQKEGCPKRLNTDRVFVSVKQGTPTKDELEELGDEIAEKWKKLGRRLGLRDATLQDIHQADDELCEKGYHMLIHWKKEKGSAATYKVLCDALQHKLVQREDLAEQFCYIDGLPKKRRLPSENSLGQKEGCAKRLKTDRVFDSVKQGTPTNDELEELGVEIAVKWMKLGRRLGVKEPKLQDIRQAHDELGEKGYHMLIHWKQEKGSAATYQVLCDALHHNLVQRADLAEQFCCIDEVSSGRRLQSGSCLGQGEEVAKLVGRINLSDQTFYIDAS